MSEALKPCPFCGSAKVDAEGWSSLEQYRGTDQWRSGPACDDCSGSADSVEQWNTRAPDPEAAAEMVRLREEVEFQIARVADKDAELAFADQVIHEFNSGAELQAALKLNNELLDRALTAERLLSEAWEKAAGIADLYADNPVKCLAYSRADYENGACDNAIAIAAAIRSRGGGG